MAGIGILSAVGDITGLGAGEALCDAVAEEFADCCVALVIISVAGSGLMRMVAGFAGWSGLFRPPTSDFDDLTVPRALPCTTVS